MLQPLMAEGQLYWEREFPEEVWPAFTDFRNFLSIVWVHLGLPAPTRAQYEIAHRLQFGFDSVEAQFLTAEEIARISGCPREDIIRAFRSLGKSYVTAAFVIWRVMRNPRDEKIMVVSASGDKAKQFVSQVKSIIESMPLLSWLLQGPREGGARRRDEADQFDVARGSVSQSYSICARGIFGGIRGSRATLIVADDIEVEKNTLTEDARGRLLGLVQSDFIPIAKTEHGIGDIIFLGTPATEESIYNRMVAEMGFRCFCIPVRFPSAEKLANYTIQEKDTGRDIDILAFYLRHAFDQGELRSNSPTDSRFGEEELIKIESKGRASFALQYMLDTSLSDAEKYPLKLHDLIVFSSSPLKGPNVIQWGRDSQKLNVVKDISNVGFSGDQYLRPLFVDHEWSPYDAMMLFVDPAGRGADETAWVVMGSLYGTLYCLHVGGHQGDPAGAMEMIARDAKRFQVNVIEYEPNFGGGMWGIAFGPVLQKIWPGGCAIQESEWAKGQKEARIIDTLEPVMTQHRLVLSEDVVKADVQRYLREGGAYSLCYQLTHLSRDRGCLRHDDRIDALAGAVAHYMRTMGQDQASEAKSAKEAALEEEYERMMMWQNGNPYELRLGPVRVSAGRYLGDLEYEEVYQWKS